MKRFAEKTNLLMVDDNPIDRSLAARALRETGAKNQILFFENGKKLMEYLRRNLALLNEVKRDFHPFLILLDLNMPIMDGREVLKIIKKDPRFKRIPVVVLTSSNAADDIDESYQEGANTVFAKPTDFNEIVALMEAVKSYWLQKAQLPFSMV